MSQRASMVFGIILLLSATAGCTEPAAIRSAVDIRDSLGVRIVTHSALSGPRMVVDSVPEVVIGARDSGEGHDLAFVLFAVRQSTGRILIGNRATNEIRVFGPDGTFLKSIGGTGEGPGEFRALAAVRLGRADTILAGDLFLGRRITIFDPDGRFVRVVVPGAWKDRAPTWSGVMGGDVGVFRSQVAGGGNPRATGVTRDTFEVVLRPLDGEWGETLGRYPGAEWFHSVQPDSYSTWFRPFGRDFHSAVGETRAWLATSDLFELRGIDRDGALTTIIRVEGSTQPVSELAKEEFFAYQTGPNRQELSRQMWRDIKGTIPFPETLPAFSSLLAAPGDVVWVQETRLEWDPGPRTWHRFAADGTGLGSVLTPGGVDILHVGKDHVLGLFRDELDVEYVAVYGFETGISGR